MKTSTKETYVLAKSADLREIKAVYTTREEADEGWRDLGEQTKYYEVYTLDDLIEKAVDEARDDGYNGGYNDGYAQCEED